MKKLIHWLLPPASCLLCREIVMPNQHMVCDDCRGELPWGDVKSPTSLSLFHYQPPIDHWISQLKFQDKLIYARFFSQCFITQLQNYKIPLPDYLLPVPLHRKRLRERGFNQALEIAKPIAKYFKIPLANNFIERKKYTKPQSDLSAMQRASNVKNAFALKKPFKAKHIAIIDDVVTTGNTVGALVQLLKDNGIEKIDIWCVARPDY
jgi:ComF family protein